MISSLAGVVETITNFFQQLVDSGYLTLDYIFYVSLSLELILIIFFLIKSSYSYELRLDRSLDKLNKWLYYNQYIDESNLMEFNRKIKKSPKLLRYHWQQYMLYRDNDPSHFMSEYNCIEKPIHTSSFSSNIKNLNLICYTFAIATFLLNLASFSTIGQTNIGYVLLNSLLTPVAILVFSTFFSILLRSWQNANLAGLYQNFHLFRRYIDKGCTTLPDYIDFEVLFTKEEIKKGIPVLNEYLEKRARQEQKELEAAMLNSVEHEEYDFSKLGLNGSQILDRAMKETEIYLNKRQRTLAEIQQLESEIESAKRNYENNQKEYERKMQASKENVDRLRKQQEESTNRIESNYIRKQQTDEIKKQEQLEKDYESTTMRYNQEINSLTNEINTRKQELEEKKTVVEEAMKAEYNTFSTRVFKAINDEVRSREKNERSKLVEEKDNYAKMLEQSNMILEEKELEIQKLANIIKSANIDLGDHGEFYDENLRKEAQIRHQNQKEEESQIAENVKVQIEDSQQPQEAKQQQSADEIVYDEYGGYYDGEGYYRYKNGTFYDPQGNFHDEFGGYYDKDGNYYPPQDKNVEKIEDAEIQKTDETVNYDEFGGYYDKDGYYRYKNGSYYDLQGNFHDIEEIKDEAKTQDTEPVIEKEISEKQPTDEQKNETEQVTQEQTENNEKNEVKRGRGRPKKIVTDTEEKAPSEIKRGRGRPKKIVTDTGDDEGGKMPEVKLKRGRPRKIAIKEEESVDAPKRKRGRPKKIDAQSVLDEFDTLSAQIRTENEKLEKERNELSKQIDSTLSKIDTDKNENNSSNSN